MMFRTTSTFGHKRKLLFGPAVCFLNHLILLFAKYVFCGEIFSSFKDEKGNFGDDCKGILALYEAAHYCVEGESIFHNAINFTTEYLKEYVKHSKDDEYLSTLANHALELPPHWRMLRLEARWFIDVYEKHHPDMKPVLLKLAKLNFNVVEEYGSGGKVEFCEGQVDGKFLLDSGGQGRVCRRMSTKVHALITTIDDVYDVYGTLGELELFTDAVERLVVAR
ncbi:hypothetical protein LWI29_034998 [Acer saccharum]|uniref:Uncharacterized protein n=1 Tax=Acer saccharum TaxID=4024 RepID=A0AA39RTU8_ACESA|nr:hypothetical protein LWI29_034998 [Acer saccharum]